MNTAVQKDEQYPFIIQGFCNCDPILFEPGDFLHFVIVCQMCNQTKRQDNRYYVA